MRNLRFVMLAVICFVFIVTNMHNGTIGIALVAMCDPACELAIEDALQHSSSSKQMDDSAPVIVHDSNDEDLEYLEFSGEVGSIAINWHYASEEGKTLTNGTQVTTCTWKQVENCKLYKWSHTMRGLMTSASYLSSILFQIPCNSASELFGGFWVLVITIVTIALIDLILPTLASFSFTWVIILRFILGLMATSQAPACYTLINEWTMKRDKSIAMAMLLASSTFGNALILIISSLLVHAGFDWPIIFYLSSAASIGALILLVTLIRERPHQVSWISEEELRLIDEDHLQQGLLTVTKCNSVCNSIESLEESKVISKPWKAVLTNQTFTSLLFFAFCTNCILTIYLNELPIFLKQTSEINIAKNGLINGASFLIRIIAVLFAGYSNQKLIDLNFLSTGTVRRLYSVILGCGQGICFIILPFVTKDTFILTIVLLMATFASGMSSGCIFPLHFDISTKYSVFLLTITNTVANLTGLIVPLTVTVTQSLFPKDPILGWTIIFVSYGAVAIFSNIIFLIFIRVEEQSFDSEVKEKTEDSIVSPRRL